jgi:hypothetical protein
MRIAMVLTVVVLVACASEKLATTPPAGVDLSGHWKLNEADSDDPLRLMQSQLAQATASAGPGGSTGPPGPGGRQGGRGGGFGAGGPIGPTMPSVAVLDEALRWPGKDLSIKQSGGVVTFTAGGVNRFCRPAALQGQHHHTSAADDPRGRDARCAIAWPWGCTAPSMWLGRRHSGGAIRRSRGGSPAVRAALQRVGRRPATGRSGEFQRRPLERLHGVSSLGSGSTAVAYRPAHTNKKAGHSPAFNSPCHLWRSLVARSR